MFGIFRTTIKQNIKQKLKNLLGRRIKTAPDNVEIAPDSQQDDVKASDVSRYYQIIELGKVLAAKGNFNEAIDHYQQAIALNSDHAEVYFHLGIALESQGNQNDAILSYQRANTKQIDWPVPYLALGDAFLTQGDLEQATANYRQGLLIQPDWPEFYFGLGRALYHQGELEQAIEHCRQAAALRADYADAHLYLGLMLVDLGKIAGDSTYYADAIRHYQQAIALRPDSADAYQHLSQAFEATEQWQEAIASSQQAIALRPDWAEAHLRLGSLYESQGYCELAAASYQQVVTLQPEWLEAYVPTGKMLWFSGNVDQAVHYWQEGFKVQHSLAVARQLDPSSTRLLSSLWTKQLGHLCLLDIYIKAGLLGVRPQSRSILFTQPDRIANPCLLSYWQPYLEIHTNPSEAEQFTESFRYLEDYFHVGLVSGVPMPILQVGELVQKQWQQEGRAPLLKISEEHDKRGWDCLRQMGIPENAWFVCLHVREAGYGKSNSLIVEQTSPRNADISTYFLAISTIVAQGGWVIRLGDSTMSPLPAMDQVIDYAHSDIKSDWMDIFLCGTCRFFVGTNSGPCFVPGLFGVPSAITNWVSIGIRPLHSHDIFIPKLCWSEAEQRYLTFEQMMSPPFNADPPLQQIFDRYEVKLINNTPEEIDDLIREMLETLEGKIIFDVDDQRLQTRFTQMSQAHHSHASSHIGHSFLRKYATLLPDLTNQI